MMEKGLSGAMILGTVILFIVFYLFPVHGFNRSKHRAVGMIVMTLWLIYPDLCHVIFSSMSCINPSDGKKNATPFENTSRMYRDLDVICWSGHHLYYFVYVTVPGIILWVIGLPMVFYYCLRTNKAHLKNRDPQIELPRYKVD